MKPDDRDKTRSFEPIKEFLEYKARNQKADDCYWINIEEDCRSYCSRHIEAAVKKMERENPDEEVWYECDNGEESDSPKSCETCGIPLECSFTKYALEYELEHFERHGLDTGNKRDCYDMYRVFNDGETEYHPELLDRAMAIVVKALIKRSVRK